MEHQGLPHHRAANVRCGRRAEADGRWRRTAWPFALADDGRQHAAEVRYTLHNVDAARLFKPRAVRNGGYNQPPVNPARCNPVTT